MKKIKIKLCLVIIPFVSCFCCAGEKQFVADFINFVSVSRGVEPLLYNLAIGTPFFENNANITSSLLCKYYPQMQSILPYVSLGDFPTKIQKLPDIFFVDNAPDLYIKRDDLGGRKHEPCSFENCPHGTFGGGKVRKLEFILADALCNGAQTVLSFSSVGSNHAAATAFYAHSLGLKSIIVLQDGEPSEITRRNILVCQHYGEEVKLCVDSKDRDAMLLFSFLKQKFFCGSFPYIIPELATSLLDIIAFVNAAFELKEQIDRGEIPEPSKIYIALGTTRSAIGLLLGLRVIGIKSKIIAIKVGNENMVSVRAFLRCALYVKDRLRSYDSSFPDIKLRKNDVEIVVASDYEQMINSEPIKTAIKSFEDFDSLRLFDNYSRKAIGTLFCHMKKKGVKKNETILFWNTYYDNEFPSITSSIDYTQLSKNFYHHFENP